jgi:ABC-type transporter Mla subunit MlaD
VKASKLYLRVGVLVVVGAALIVGFLLFLAGTRGGAVTLVETFTEESVQGLDVGAPVRYRGVAVGRVTEIGLIGVAYRDQGARVAARDRQLVLVRFGLNQGVMDTTPGLESMIRTGLRARIAPQGITGVNYVELDFVDPERFPVPPITWQPRNPLVPSMPSTVAQVRNVAESLIARLSEVPLERMANDLAGFLESLNHQTSTGDLAQTLREAAGAMASLRGQIDGTDLPGLVAELRGIANSAREMTSGGEFRTALGSISSAAEDLRRTTQRLPQTIEALDRTLRATRGTTTDVQSELIPILNDLRATAASLRATMDSFRQSPSQSIFGAPPPPERRR